MKKPRPKERGYLNGTCCNRNLAMRSAGENLRSWPGLLSESRLVDMGKNKLPIATYHIVPWHQKD